MRSEPHIPPATMPLLLPAPQPPPSSCYSSTVLRPRQLPTPGSQLWQAIIFTLVNWFIALHHQPLNHARQLTHYIFFPSPSWTLPSYSPRPAVLHDAQLSHYARNGTSYHRRNVAHMLASCTLTISNILICYDFPKGLKVLLTNFSFSWLVYFSRA